MVIEFPPYEFAPSIVPLAENDHYHTPTLAANSYAITAREMTSPQTRHGNESRIK
jgi:hypothetical protein